MVKRTELVSPRGIAVHPWLNKPDAKYADGDLKKVVFKTDLRLDGNVPTTQPFVDNLKKQADVVFEEALAAAKEEKNGKLIAALRKEGAFCPVTADIDETGEPTGDYVVRFKKRAHFQDKQTGEWVNTTLGLWTPKKGVPFTGQVGSGSLIRVAFFVSGWTSPQGAGITLKMTAVRVLKAEEFAGYDPFADDDVEFASDAEDEAPTLDSGSPTLDSGSPDF